MTGLSRSNTRYQPFQTPAMASLWSQALRSRGLSSCRRRRLPSGGLKQKKIMNSPKWKGLHPVIQSSGNRFLDIRKLLLYKANHMEASSPRCNCFTSQVGPARLVLTAKRDVRAGEELLWEYSPTLPGWDD